MKLIPFAVVLLSMVSLTSVAQKQHEKWLFGYNAALDFSSGTPQPLAGSAMQTDEGSVSLADANGNLLFYSNGVTVYNRNHQAMSNGTGLWGHISTTQSTLTVPMPGEDSVYYLFTVSAQLTGPHKGLAYSVVDMRQDGGLGDVTIKNIPLTDSTTEKLTATRHANGKDAWVVCHKWNSDEFHAWRVTCGSIEGPVISRAGSVHLPDSSMFGTASALGCMRISPDGQRLALAWAGYRSSTSHESDGRIEYFGFDDATGVVSGGALLDAPGTWAYGVAFSPSSRYLYASVFGLVSGVSYAAIRQYDLEAPDVDASLAYVAVGTPEYGTLQLGPDGRLYVARLSFVGYISAIPFPDSAAPACGFVAQGAALAPGTGSTWGLPNHWDDYPDSPAVFGYSDTTHCKEIPLILEAEVEGATAWIWNNGTTQPQVTVTHPGWWVVDAIRPCDTLRDSVWVELIRCTPLPVIFVARDTIVCEDDLLYLDASDPQAIGYRWNNGATTPRIAVADSGWWWVDVDLGDTLIRDSIHFGYRECRCIEAPNVFTPNADGVNDRFLPTVECQPETYALRIYDRWGNDVFLTSSTIEGWDGHDFPEGVYYYIIEWKQAAGLLHREVGNLVLMR